MARSLTMLALLTAFCLIAAVAQSEPQQEVSSGLWFVELKGRPVADGGSLKDLQAEKSAFRSSAQKAGVKYIERFAFNTLWNGLSVRMDSSELGKLRSVAGVSKVYPVSIVSIPETTKTPSEPDLITALAMTGADIAQSELGYTGVGIKVAVMDTGVDYDHPDLGGCFGNGCRVFTGHDFVGDAFNADPTSASFNDTPVPDALPDDCNGHGTHVAGIVGANGTVKGVAPDVKFGAYRVFGCAGSTTTDIMIAAMERALADKMQILNMSIGSSFQWPDYPSAAAADRLVNKGVIVVCSIGNAGANGLYAASAPGVGQKVIGTASFNNSHVNNLLSFTITPDGQHIGYNQATAAPTAPTAGTFPLARTGTQTSTADACNGATAPPAGSLTGMVALIRRGTCSFYEKSKNAEAAGAAAVVIYNNVAGIQNITVAGTPAVGIPVVSVSQADGNLIDTRLAGGPVDLTWTNDRVSVPNVLGGLISDFSSYGMVPDLSTKPDIGAPGGLIYSTYPVELGSYATISGTSMASPHVAGAAALLLQARPKTNPQLARTILQNSADPKNWWGNPGLGLLDNVHRQGAGLVDIDDAILSTTIVDPGKLALGESEAGPVTRTLTIQNKSASPVTYDVSHVAALATGPNSNTVSFFSAPSTVSFSSSSVLVPAGGSAAVDVTVTPNAGLANRSLFGGYVVFTPQGGGPIYRVPFAGFKGDYQSIQVLVPTANNFPRLARLTACTLRRPTLDSGLDCLVGGSYSLISTDGTVFTMNNPAPPAVPDVPYFLTHLEHQSRKFVIEIFEAGSNDTWFRATDEDFLPRNSTATSFFAWPFGGQTASGNKIYTLPNGTYYAVISVQKALGETANLTHWETWTSPTFIIARP